MVSNKGAYFYFVFAGFDLALAAWYGFADPADWSGYFYIGIAAAWALLGAHSLRQTRKENAQREVSNQRDAELAAKFDELWANLGMEDEEE